MFKKLCLLVTILGFLSTGYAGTVSDDKDPLRNLENIQATKARLAEAVSRTAGFRLRYGAQSMFLSSRDEGAFSSYSSGSTTPSNTGAVCWR